eukprot:jgi/Orpsp1_1/1178743/evm.model.c7180000066564.2
MKYIFVIVTLIISKIVLSQTIDINAVAFSGNGAAPLYSNFINDFNTYSKENNLNINLNLNFVSNVNLVNGDVEYESFLDTLFMKKSKKYDIIFFDNIYRAKFGSYMLDLKNLLPKEHIDMYMEGIANQTCIFNNRIIGLPVVIDFNILYCNNEYLEKYKKDIPKTWDELISTSKYILKMEKELYNNTELFSYNGYFSDDEGGMCSIYEFIFSCRDSYTDLFPELYSQTYINALEKMKELKDEIGSDVLFKQDLSFVISQSAKNSLLFFKFWYMPQSSSTYKYVAIPGIKEGISGSVVGGPNVGISIYSEKSKREAVMKALKYITSKEMQRKYVIRIKSFSPIPSLYEEEEVCKTVNCDFFKSIQLISRPTAVLKDYTNYSSKYRKYIYEFLYGDKSPMDVFQKIEDITKIYYISLDTTDTSVGLTLFIYEIILSTIFIGSLLFLYIEKFKPYFRILPNKYWIIYIIGQTLMLSNIFIDIGQKSILKCHLKLYIISISYSLYLIPLFYFLIINFPEENNKISVWVNNNKYIFLLSFVIFDIIISSLILLTPFTIEDKMFEDEKIFQVCKMNNPFGNLFICLIYVFKIIIILLSIFLVFLEWNLKSIHSNINLISISYYSNILLLIGYIIISYFINIKNYIVHFIIYEITYILFSLINYIFLYGIKISFGMTGKKNKEPGLNDIVNDLLYMANNKTLVENDISSNKKSISKLSEKILNYHNKQSINYNVTSSSCIKSNNYSI